VLLLLFLLDLLAFGIWKAGWIERWFPGVLPAAIEAGSAK
jgi:hypothetical protein